MRTIGGWFLGFWYKLENIAIYSELLLEIKDIRKGKIW